MTSVTKSEKLANSLKIRSNPSLSLSTRRDQHEYARTIAQYF